MLKKRRDETLSDKITGVLNATPAIFDPEDDHIDNTHAQVVNADAFDEDDAEEILLSKFRKQNVDLLADLDERYSGVKASRKDLRDSDGEESDSDESHEDSTVLEESSDLETNESGVGQDEDYSKESDSEESGDVEESSGNEDDFVGAEVEENDIQTMRETDLSAQIKKGQCVRNQMQMWESLLEMRIQLQKSLITANKMPQKATFTEIKNSSGKEFSDQLAITKNSLAKVLDRLLFLQKLLLKKYPETKNLDQQETKANEDEEIASDTDDEKIEATPDAETEELPRKKRKLSEFAQEIGDCHDKYKNYRNSVIQKWNEKTRITTLKNNSNAPSVVNHIDHILSDKEKLIKRTQVKRSEYTILGQEPVANEQQLERNQEEHNPEIFDDDDFYHQLLRELIEVKSADLTDPVQLSRQWIQLQNLRSKMKRKVDTRATKGRKIRYAVHTKLVNFMAPIDENLWTEEAKNELFSSLFGKLERASVV